MAVLVTRPHPDDEATAAALRARGFEVLRAPMLRFEPVPFRDDEDAAYGAVIVTIGQRAARHRVTACRQPAARNCRCLRSANIPRRRPATPDLRR